MRSTPQLRCHLLSGQAIPALPLALNRKRQWSERRQGIFETNFCLDPNELLSKGQAEELSRVMRASPRLVNDDLVEANLSRWLA